MRLKMKKIKLTVLYIINIVLGFCSAYIFPTILLTAFHLLDQHDSDGEFAAPILKLLLEFHILKIILISFLCIVFLALLLLTNTLFITYYCIQYKKRNISKTHMILLSVVYIFSICLAIAAFNIRSIQMDFYTYHGALREFFDFLTDL